MTGLAWRHPAGGPGRILAKQTRSPAACAGLLVFASALDGSFAHDLRRLDAMLGADATELVVRLPE